ncbi:hypothetical protein KP509_14G004900 [Ceratopteris richardii]|uniref:Uncharacterized protein n=1 Tax=Ceratopteris richardii TaxID=49495 RepID=A0A8T2TBW3_CERRI|nr:hypothetical protein KP509_14G004900 [Ceratopteris richardii]
MVAQGCHVNTGTPEQMRTLNPYMDNQFRLLCAMDNTMKHLTGLHTPSSPVAAEIRTLKSLLPRHLYAAPGVASAFARSISRPSVGTVESSYMAAPVGASSDKRSPSFPIAHPSEPGKIEMYSPAFYAAYTVGGILSGGLTHMAVTPLNLVKCNMQIDPAKYKSIGSGFGILLKEQGPRGFFRGGVPTLLGYSEQGACKFGFYEYFKKYYSDLAGPDNAEKYRTFLYLVGSASAEFIADVALCPFEAVKGRVQTKYSVMLSSSSV